MTCDISSTILDPVQGLVDYVNDIKPYHTKIAEVIVEYQHNELVEVTMVDAIDMRIQILHPDPGTALVIGSCPVINKQIWGAIDDQTDFTLDDPVPYLDVVDEYSTAPGQTVFSLSRMVNGSNVANISSITVNGVATTSYTLNLGAASITLSSPTIQRGDYVVISYQSSTPNKTNFTVTVNGVPAEVTLTSINTFTINSPLPLYTNDWVVAVLCGPSVEEFVCYDGFDTTVYDDPDTFVIAEVDDVTDTIIVPRNRTHEFTAGTEILLKTNIIATGGSPSGLIATDPADNLRVYTVLSSTYTAGTATTDPITTITVDATIRGIDPPASVLNPGEAFVFTVGLNPLILQDVLGYSDIDDRPLETPNEGRFVLDVVSINETTNTITVDGDLSTSTLQSGDNFFVGGSTNHSGVYAISSITYGGSPGTTAIVVTEDILEAEAVGDSATATFDIMSNAFVIKGGVSSRFRQGHIFEIFNGANRGTYVTLTADIALVEIERQTLDVSVDGQVGFTLTGSPSLSIPGISQQATDEGVWDSSLLSVKLIRDGEQITLGVTVTSPTSFMVVSGPLPLLASDTGVVAIVSDRHTRVRVTDDLVPYRDPISLSINPQAIAGLLRDYPLGFGSQQVFCDQLPYTVVRVLIKEHLQFSNMNLDLTEDIIAYNLENTDQVVYDGIPQGTTFDPHPPTDAIVYDYWYPALPIADVVAPNQVIAVGDFSSLASFDITGTTTNVGSYTVSGAVFAFSVTYGAWVTTFTVNETVVNVPASSSTGLIVDPSVISTYPLAVYQQYVAGSPIPYSTPTSPQWRLQQSGYNETKAAVSGSPAFTALNAYVNPYDLDPHQVTHTTVTGNDVDSTFTLAGGNYLRRMTQELTLNGSGVGSPEGEIGNWRPTTYHVSEVDATANSFTMIGDVSHIFTAGSPLGAGDVIMLHSYNNEEEFIVQKVVVGGSPIATTVTVSSPTVIETDYFNIGSPAVEILQNYSKDLAWVTAGTFNPSTQNTIVAVNSLDIGSPSPLLSNVDIISYTMVGPLRFDIKIHQAITAAISTTDAMGISEEALGIPQLFNIVAIDLVNNTFTIEGDYTNSFAPGTNFSIQNSYNQLNNQPGFSGSPYNDPLKWTVAQTGSPVTWPNLGGGSPETTIITVVEPINAVGSPPVANVPYGTIVLVEYVIGQVRDNQAAAAFEDTLFFGWGTVLRWQIVAQSAATNTIYLETDLTGMIYVNDAGNIVGSYLNDADYDVVSVSYDLGSDRTAVVLNGPIITISTPQPSPGSPYGSPYYQDTETVGSPPGLVGSPPVYVGSPRDYSLLGMWQLDNMDVTGWFQYNVIGANVLTDVFVVQGDATSDIQAGQEFRIFGTPGNDGLYMSDIGAPPIFDGVNTTIIVDVTSKKHIVTSQGLLAGSPVGSPYTAGGGVLQAARDYGIQIFHRDTIGTSVDEVLDGPVPTEGGNIVGAFDYPGFDQGTFDEDLNVLKFFTAPNERT